MRAAQRDLKGAQLRELSAQRRAAVDGLVKEAVKLAGKADPRNRSKLPLGEVETTLTAAMSDAEVAEQVRSGRLVRAATYAGFGEVPRPQLRLVTAATCRGVRRYRVRRRRTDKRAREAERAAQRRSFTKELTDRPYRSRRRPNQTWTARRRPSGTAPPPSTTSRRAWPSWSVNGPPPRPSWPGSSWPARRAERALTAARRRVGDVEAALEAFDEERGG